MPTTPATANTTAPFHWPLLSEPLIPPATRSCDHSSSSVMGTITQEIQVSTRLVPSCSSLVTTEYLRASIAKRLA